MLDKAYQPGSVEGKWLAAWETAGLFRSKPGAGRKFSIVIPPPNVTGALHMGHALNEVLQDVLIRWHKLKGENACWVYGTDHGGIATQNVMEKQLKAEGKTRQQIGRDAFVSRMQEWTRECKKTISGQLKSLGCALDFSREAFTMDDARAKAVFHAFKALWDKGLVYRGERMVNWCVRCGTALSDLEVEHEERKGQLWHIRYLAADGQGSLVVATTRPETMLGDTAVAVHPRDDRYAAFKGRTLRLPLIEREIPVVFDEAVDMSFGTGAVKVTPAHDPNDFEMGLRHHLPMIKVIGPDGKMTADAKSLLPGGASYVGLSREQAREKVVEDLKASGLLEKVEDHKHAVSVCYRCSQAIEPLVSYQWFVKMKTLAERAAEAARQGQFRIHPDNWAKPYLAWLDGIKDWCVSRQIWWGHRIPVWYCLVCNDLGGADFHQLPNPKGVVVSSEKPQGPCPHCGAAKGEYVQDPDVLDTWFSSSLWPMAVFGWPDQTPDLEYYYPTSVLVTGYEILYLWVARMQMMGLEFTGCLPFPDAIIHGIVRDKRGKKMSKSLGNVIDPLDLMKKHGTDALRFSLALQARPGKDIPYSEESVTGSVHFANKLWNSTRFVLMNLGETAGSGLYSLLRDGVKSKDLTPALGELELADRWILAEYQEVLEDYERRMKAFELAQAADLLYGFLWDKFCDWYVELAKIRLQGPDGPKKDAVRAILVEILSGMVKLLHPFMPFVTEELYAVLKPCVGETAPFALAAGAPRLSADWSDDQARPKMELLMEAVRAIRSLRSQLNIPPGLKIPVAVSGGGDGAVSVFKEHEDYFKALARAQEISYCAPGERPSKSAAVVVTAMTLYLPLAGVVDFDVERERLGKELAKVEKEIEKIALKVSNKDFIARAPADEIELARTQNSAALERKKRLEEILLALR